MKNKTVYMKGLQLVKLNSKIIILIIVLLVKSINVYSQVSDEYYVNTDVANVRANPSLEGGVLFKLDKGDVVEIVNKTNTQWWLVDFSGRRGYVSSKLLSLSPYSGWAKKTYNTGDVPDCTNIAPEFDKEIDNYLRINVGSGADVVVKLMQKRENNDMCIRIAYIRSGSSFDMKNIPQGVYYLKIAYGKNWRQKNIEGKCEGIFVSNPIYEIGKDRLDFNLVESGEKIMIPYFELSLDVIVTKVSGNKFTSNKISAEVFNK